MKTRAKKTETKSAASSNRGKPRTLARKPKTAPPPPVRRGRPPGRDPNRRQAMLSIRCSADEKRALQQYCESHGIELSVWVRMTMLQIAADDGSTLAQETLLSAQLEIAAAEARKRERDKKRKLAAE